MTRGYSMGTDVVLALDNGDTYDCTLRCGSTGTGGEAVFTTAYTGYEESLTDPSYATQALIFAYPLVGNYGMDVRRFESASIQPELVITRRMTDDVTAVCRRHGVPVVTDVPTRSLVTTIRDEGSMPCAIGADVQEARSAVNGTPATAAISDIAEQVGTDRIRRYGSPADPTLVLLDCGVKWSMIEYLVDHDFFVTRMPNDATVSEIEDESPSLVFVSNGPGDPANYDHVIETIEILSDRYPIAGICLGQQIVAHAFGGSTGQMAFGHRGSNQPVIPTEPDDPTVRMTTQNHSFEVTDPGSLSVIERNVNDDSPESLRGDDVLTVQYHPEANPGPRDSLGFFDRVRSIAMDHND